MPSAHLVYIYNHRSADEQPLRLTFRRSVCIVSPSWTNSLGWSKGVFKTVANAPLSRSDRLAQHCFYRVPIGPQGQGRYLDETGQEIGHRVESPCGEWSLASYRWIDDRISDALGIPEHREADLPSSPMKTSKPHPPFRAMHRLTAHAQEAPPESRKCVSARTRIKASPVAA